MNRNSKVVKSGNLISLKLWSAGSPDGSEVGWSSWEQLVLKMTADLMGGCEQLGSWVHHGFGERLGTQWVLGRS